jgi:hypothetical protein
MTDPVLVALLKTLKVPDLSAGEYHIDQTITLHIKGDVTKERDELYTPTVQVPQKLLMACLLERLGAIRSCTMDVITQAMTDAIRMNESGSTHLGNFLKDYEDAMDNVQTVLGNLPKKTRSGKTKVRATVTEVTTPASVTATTP